MHAYSACWVNVISDFSIRYEIIAAAAEVGCIIQHIILTAKVIYSITKK